MDEDAVIITRNTRNEKIKKFFINNKKFLILTLSVFLILLIIYFGFVEYKEKKKIIISDRYNLLITKYSKNNVDITKEGLVEIINDNDTTYSPLSLYFIIDNQLITDNSEINKLFDVIIEDTPLTKEVRNLLILKKALYNSDYSEENELLEILKPVINSKSVWKSHALYLMAEYFYAKNEKQKSKEFFKQIISLENTNQDLKLESQKRLTRDLSE